MTQHFDPLHVQDGLTAYADAVGDLLGPNLLGVYLYGSVAGGRSNGKTSDVDVVVVLRHRIIQKTKERLLAIHQATPIPVDATFITQKEIARDVYPTPLQCVIRPVKLFRVPNGLVDFPLVRNDLYTNGRRIVGPELRSAVPPVPWSLLSACLREMFPVLLERFKNPVLMLCRAVCSLRTRRACSKAQAGQWALGSFEARWHLLIRQALCDYREGIASSGSSSGAARAFEQYCRALIPDR